jgi:hypothetical protein
MVVRAMIGNELVNMLLAELLNASETGHPQSGVKIISGWTNTIRHENPKSFGSCKVRQ